MSLKVFKLIDLPDFEKIVGEFLKNFVNDDYVFENIFFINYLSKYYKMNYIGNSFVVVDQDKTVALFVSSDMIVDDAFTLFGRPCILRLDESVEDLHALVKVMSEEIKTLCLRQNQSKILVRPSNLIMKYFFNEIKHLRTEFLSFLDLSLKHPIRHVRKSYRSLINWGEKNLDVKVFSSDNCLFEDVQRMMQFHIEVSGRVTRSEDTWRLQYDQIRSKYAFMIQAYYEKKLVASNLIMIGGRQAYYAVGVYDRQQMAMKRPMSHYPIWRAILEAKNYGCISFLLGSVNNDEDISDKEINIAMLKDGFASSIMDRNIFELNIHLL
jgi:hypothetical protein